MDDLIYRNVLIDELKKIRFPCMLPSGAEYLEGIHTAVNRISGVINAAPAVNFWILTKDRLPDKPGRYLAYAERTIYCNHNEIDDEEYRTNVLYFDGKEWTDTESICYDVIRWMPIPEYRTS